MTEEKVAKRKTRYKIKVGDRFGRWIVLDFIKKHKGHFYYRCECDCDTVKTVEGCSLLNGRSRSCGCLCRERHITHGMTGTPEYCTWDSMIQRCTNSNNPAYWNYGGRGIPVCAEWLNSFEAFFKDMGERPEGFTIERKDNNLGYFPGNCKWATRTEQMRNCRISRNNKTGVNGICWDKRYQKYCTEITANYKRYHIGYFKKLEYAKIARIAAEQKYWR